MANEGGGIHVDGEGAVLLTDTVQLDRFRTPDMSRNQIEAEFRHTLGVKRSLWLPRGLYRDSQHFGTRGHVDIVATIPNSGTILLHRQMDPPHPDFHLYDVHRAAIEESTAPDGNPWNIVDIHAPKTLKDDEGWVDYSYVNHLVVNGGVIACSFDDENDAAALAQVYPGRKVVSVDARNIFAYGGGIHCITQHQPKSTMPQVRISTGGSHPPDADRPFRRDWSRKFLLVFVFLERHHDGARFGDPGVPHHKKLPHHHPHHFAVASEYLAGELGHHHDAFLPNT